MATSEITLPTDYLKSLQVDVLGPKWTKALMVVLLITGTLLIGISVWQWGRNEGVATVASKVEQVAATSTTGVTETITCSTSRLTATENTATQIAEVQLPVACPTPSPMKPKESDDVTGAATDVDELDEADASKQGNTDRRENPSNTIAASDGPLDQVSEPAAQAEPTAGPSPSAAGAAPSESLESGALQPNSPTTVSKRSSNFFLVLMLMGGGALLVGSLLPRIQSIKLAGLEMTFDQTISPTLYMRILAAIMAKEKPAEAKQKAVERLDSIARPIVNVRAVGAHPRPPLLSRRTPSPEPLGGPSIARGTPLPVAATSLSETEIEELAVALLE